MLAIALPGNWLGLSWAGLAMVWYGLELGRPIGYAVHGLGDPLPGLAVLD